MPFAHDIAPALKRLPEAPYADALARGRELFSALKARKERELPIVHLAEREDDIGAIQEIAHYFRSHFRNLVVLGTGGSSLGGQMLCTLAGKGAPVPCFLDNIDSATWMDVLSGLDAAQTGFLAISKSGETAETLAQLLAALAWIRGAQGEAAIPKHFRGIAVPGDNTLRRVAARWGIPMFDHDPKVGGRFSLFSLVAMVPAAVAGLDIRAIRRGAAEVLKDSEEPVRGAALSYTLMKAGYSANVMMPYADRLLPLAMWWRQIWAESLGKQGNGSTPVTALGAVDQHSQLQLYLDGPQDKSFTFLSVAQAAEVKLDVGLAGDDAALAYLRGHSLGALLAAEQRATAETLIARGCPVRCFHIERLNEYALGALAMQFMLETILTAGLLGVDAFDQPAVEEGKRLARETLARGAA